MSSTEPNRALQRTRHERRGCNPCAPLAAVAELGSFDGQMNSVIITAPTPTDSSELDELLWRVLWQPLGLPREVRRAFKLEGEEDELVAKQNGTVLGGLVAICLARREMELRHLAVAPDAQGLGIGRSLVTELLRMAVDKGARRISTTARNTSAGFFRKLGFTSVPAVAPEHPVFAEHGIMFELMEIMVEQARPLPGTERGRATPVANPEVTSRPRR